MDPENIIGRIGFRRWYERQLIESHAWLISGVLCAVAIASCLEELGNRGSPLRLLALVGLAFGAGVVAVYAVQRYQHLMELAERLAAHSTCARCGTYARFSLIGTPLQVRCRVCGNEWSLV